MDARFEELPHRNPRTDALIMAGSVDSLERRRSRAVYFSALSLQGFEFLCFLQVAPGTIRQILSQIQIVDSGPRSEGRLGPCTVLRHPIPRSAAQAPLGRGPAARHNRPWSRCGRFGERQIAACQEGGSLYRGALTALEAVGQKLLHGQRRPCRGGARGQDRRCRFLVLAAAAVGHCFVESQMKWGSAVASHFAASL